MDYLQYFHKGGDKYEDTWSVLNLIINGLPSIREVINEADNLLAF